jgi:hypothetical protein
MSALRAMAASAASKTTAAGSAPWRCFTMSTPRRSLQSDSCSTAAARNVSLAARITRLPSLRKSAVSFAIDVVFPTPLTPHTRMTVGPDGAKRTSLPCSRSRDFRSRFSHSRTWSVDLISPFL